MIGTFERFVIVLLAALITYVLAYVYYRRTSAASWGYVSVWLLELPTFFAVITGVQNLQHYDLFMHAFGIPVFAALLVIGDILLIEIALVGALRPISFILPRKLSTIFRVEGAIKTLQKYHALPKPDRAGTVFTAAVIGGLVSLAMLFAAGAFA